MTADNGFSGQESDVNRACSAFGLDTVNYRAFPDTGPVTLQAAEPPIPPCAPPEQAMRQAPIEQIAPFEPRLLNVPPAPPPIFGHTPAPSPYQPAPVAEDAGASVLSFPLLAQALPAAARQQSKPISAFAMARTMLRAAPANETQTPQNEAHNPAFFGAAFAAAFNAAYGNSSAATPQPQPAPDLSSIFSKSKS